MTPHGTAAAPEAFTRIVDTWTSEPDVRDGVLALWPAAALSGLLGSPAVVHGDELPPLWHEVYLHPVRELEGLGPDGHPVRDALVPGIAGRRRMFGGGRVEVVAPIRIGDSVVRQGKVISTQIKKGRTGWLLLVTEQHELSVDGQVCVVDERDIVYRLPEDVAATKPELPPVLDTETAALVPDERLLFMFSALTYNAHRIHYDRAYAVDVEGHPDLVVHGPLLALRALEEARRHFGCHAARVSYRLLSPAYCGRGVEFEVTPHGDRTATIVARQQGRACLTLDAAA
ncbi:MaoC family dehydratase N-terminal domain-containing protein [Rhodococcus sp. IEGM 1381]|uniref:FAS1-like dehydratase domain-containing protein n=1 Tax=Rhodococcus sp. IEGM 1381 TaxID=3047085 RepID=UPI0024B7A6BE|nr:MaoC family dehydratase N-terminal domain-containing protein [Rhodococcus sp. IEGM 1381]MDI9894451.1 MaoC family dehydratase N-terminal domain-containing protein [Rhodococcus sp. IEGM 1381]